jgi:hypothetical protein
LFTAVCEHLSLHDLVHLAAACKRFLHGDGGLETAELPTKSPVVAALCELAFPRPELIPSTRPADCCESWVGYLARCVRQQNCREAPPFAAGWGHSLIVVEDGQLLACGPGAAVGQPDQKDIVSFATPVASLAALRVRTVAAGFRYSIVLGEDGGWVCSWGINRKGQLGHGETREDAADASGGNPGCVWH